MTQQDDMTGNIMGDLEGDIVTPGKLAHFMAEYEHTHRVDEYEIHGLRVWPYLRVHLATLSLLQRSNRQAEPMGTRNLEKSGYHGPGRVYFNRFNILKNWQYARRFNLNQGVHPDHRGYDVLIVAGHSRRQWIGGHWYHYIADPMADLLEARGIRCLTWQIGAPLTPAYRPYAIISPIIRLATWWRTGLHTRRPLLSPPAWFHEYAQVHRELSGSDSSWHEIVSRIRYFMWISHVMAHWIRRSEVRAVMLDCWTNWHMIQATIAAHRLGLPVIDIQHGIQEHTHHSYHGWRKEPPGGYAIRPDRFWVWGERAEKLYGQTNLIGSEIIRGGNPWLERWRTNTDPVLAREISGVKEHTHGFRRAILVTTSVPATKKLSYIKKMIALSPGDWLWFIRLHPTVNREKNAIEQELEGERILVEEGTQRPLYALLQVVDLHASIVSTCSYEALAFGKPTILIDSGGAMIFREFVASGAMFFAERPEDFGDMAELAFKTDPALLKELGHGFFADRAYTDRAADRVADIARCSGSAFPRTAR